ncbi:MAG: PPC domain-containing protein [Planctomycetaceae bacterium]
MKPIINADSQSHVSTMGVRQIAVCEAELRRHPFPSGAWGRGAGTRFVRLVALIALINLSVPWICCADAPSVGYIFPAGGQRGTAVTVKVGGHFLYEGCPFYLTGPGVEATPRIERTATIWFEGPVIPLPASQAGESYPQDYAGTINIAADAPLGNRYWSVSNAQGVTAPMKFVVGDEPEIVETEISGLPIPTEVTLPVTINGRTFPREDVDIWKVQLKQGEAITAEVNAARIGSPIDSHLEIRNARGERLIENDDHFGADSFVQFVAPEEGSYFIHIHDMNLGGLQHYVYRLKLISGAYINHQYPLGGRRGSKERYELLGVQLPEETADVDLTSAGPEPLVRYRHAAAKSDLLIPVDDLPEYREPIDGSSHAVVTLPAVLNGRIGQPGEKDLWSFTAKQGEVWTFDLQAGRWGSPLDSVLTLMDDKGTVLASADDIQAGNSDSQLTWTAPAEGTFQVTVTDRSSNRGGREFAYRLKIAGPDVPGFRLTTALDALNVNRAAEVKWKIDAVRLGGFAGEIQLEIDNLPAGVTATATTIAMGQNSTEVVLKADASARVLTQALKVRGKALVADQEVIQPLLLATAPGDAPRTDVYLAVTIPTPFKVVGSFEQRFAPRGTTYVRRFRIDRGGYEGPFEISLADRQARHLQGVTGPKITVPAGVSEFDYPIQLTPWMEVGRTSRAIVMAVGVLKDPDGSEHKVSYSSIAPDDQIILIVEPEILTLETERATLRVQPGSTVAIPLKITRAGQIEHPVEIRLRVPAHIRGVKAEPTVISSDQSTGELQVQFEPESAGPWNEPLIIEARTVDRKGLPVIAETSLTIVPVE